MPKAEGVNAADETTETAGHEAGRFMEIGMGVQVREIREGCTEANNQELGEEEICGTNIQQFDFNGVDEG